MALYYEDLAIGATYTTPARTITETEIVTYAGLSGDFNPLHTDEEYCKKTSYGTRIAHGPLVLAVGLGLISRMGLTDGTSLGFLGMDEWQVLRPVKVGDTIKVTFTITDKRMASRGSRGIFRRRFEIVNQRSEVVQHGSMTTMIAAQREPQSSIATQ